MEHFQNNISQCKIVKTLNTLSFTVHKVIKSLCVWDKVKNQYWMPAIFGPSGSFVISTGMILSWKSLHGIRNTSRSHSL